MITDLRPKKVLKVPKVFDVLIKSCLLVKKKHHVTFFAVGARSNHLGKDFDK